jgi:flavin-dependent dehydrogenase
MERVSDTFEAVSQVSLARKSPVEQDICMIGDTAGMIAPLCGDGMAMALRSAELAVPPVADFLAGSASSAQLRECYTSAWNEAFGMRLRLGRGIHRAALRPGWAAMAVRACRWMPGLGRWLIQHTRG